MQRPHAAEQPAGGNEGDAGHVLSAASHRRVATCCTHWVQPGVDQVHHRPLCRPRSSRCVDLPCHLFFTLLLSTLWRAALSSPQASQGSSGWSRLCLWPWGLLRVSVTAVEARTWRGLDGDRTERRVPLLSSRPSPMSSQVPARRP